MNFTRPTRVRGGHRQEIKADHHNALARCIEEIQDFLFPSRRKKARRSGGGGGCIAWKPTFRTGEETSYVRFRLGLLNQLAADNWNDELEIAADATKWIVLNVTASNGKITGYEIALDDATPTENQEAENYPPDSFKIVLGVIDSLKATMAVCENLTLFGSVTRVESRTPPATGAEPFTRWWQWTCYQQTEGEYPFIT